MSTTRKISRTGAKSKSKAPKQDNTPQSARPAASAKVKAGQESGKNPQRTHRQAAAMRASVNRGGRKRVEG
ncbi:MAG: hypothetical protein H0T89_26165 [Deltaproteobacteria bacterium]|nr:hypothetical protein [Deltaproteobacteria bacterium]MDQ3299401.1 hypothetical protein [Myxococcota bacterium]